MPTAAAPISRSRCSRRRCRSIHGRRRRSSNWGRLALAAGDAARAVTHLEAALAADPDADGVHYALAMAYRARGDEQRAASHVRLWRDERLYPVDPLMAEITGLLKTAVVYEIRGTQAMDDRKWAEAAALFREGTEGCAPRRDAASEPRHGAVSRRRSSGSGGRVRRGCASPARVREGAVQPRRHDGGAGQGSGGDRSLLASGGVGSDDGERARQPRRCACADPESSTPRLPSTRRSSRPIRRRARRASVRPWRSFGCVATAEARVVLEEATRAHAEQPGLAHALARLLASAPDDAVRDGPRAMSHRPDTRTHDRADVDAGRNGGDGAGRDRAIQRRRRSPAPGDRHGDASGSIGSRRASDGESAPLRVEHAVTYAVGGRRPGSFSESILITLIESLFRHTLTHNGQDTCQRVQESPTICTERCAAT